MSQPSDNVYMSITFGNLPRALADEVRAAAEEVAGDYDFSIDYGEPIGDSAPTPIADEAADAVGGDPTTTPVEEPQQPTVDETPLTVDNDSGITLVTVDQPVPTSDATQVVTGEAGSPVADEGTDTPVVPDAPVDTPAPVVPDVEPTEAPVLTATDAPTADDGPQLPGLNVPQPTTADQSSER